MNRDKAKALIGSDVKFHQTDDGAYAAVLEDIIAEPNTPWRGILTVKGVISYPELTGYDDFPKLSYSENDQVEISGKWIEPLGELFTMSFAESHARALKERWEQYREANDELDKTLLFIQQELRKLAYEDLIFEDSYVYYQLVKKGRKLFIYDELKRESLSLDGCPFEFEVDYQGEWRSAFYSEGFTFITHHGEKLHLTHGDTLRLNKAQFDPYRILKNELTEPSLQALERGLSKMGIGHEHAVYCHNSLLLTLLQGKNTSEMSGVNFISYAVDDRQFVVQHHYERQSDGQIPEKAYDRFEFTADDGHRMITTYATALSND
ncbi:DUF2777 family protein [Salisediminibacterium halotolerans]|uniref:DUF2777 family protein n=1 Tax=Salisediminibacterium halotolerans TaxID=517425 RepID=UPI000EB4369C|nr:DUF2777 family protein [Salisediminibacterium halotolerans]RLJ77890.1 uncharacterized protein DUF2777 [Actinophytocola xinjiangensis]RPE88772.1 uncharacterized protein DUF2777 [Salisediminibacterium halotolerans]TWG36867.1 uncharacterized protein DUF2777 [Salisediminibacterium halotolerans]GEL08401.1 hypothetical protein SHA02_18170 [Salisediminibacterium halotolerans]